MMSSGISTESRGLTEPGAPRDARSRPQSAAFQPWHFFVLAALIAATVATVLSRSADPASLVLLSLSIGSAALAGLGLLRTLWPLVASDFRDGVEMIGNRTRAALEREKTLVLRSIKELEFDRAMGKVSEPDFREMVTRLRARALTLITQLDGHGSGYRELIEQELRARVGQRGTARSEPAVAGSHEAGSGPAGEASREERRAHVCRACAAVNDSDARFCKGCGAKLVTSDEGRDGRRGLRTQSQA